MKVQNFLRSVFLIFSLALPSAISAPGYDVWIEDTESGSGEIVNEIVKTTQLFTKVPTDELVYVTKSAGPSVNNELSNQNLNQDSKVTYQRTNDEETSKNMASGLMIGLLVASIIFILTTLALVSMVIYRYREKLCTSRMGKLNITYTSSREVYFKPTNGKTTDNVTTSLENPTYMKT